MDTELKTRNIPMAAEGIHVTALICKVVSYEKTGKIATLLSYHTK